MPTRSFTEADQQVAVSAGDSKREEKRSTFDLEPPMAGQPSFPKRFGGHGAELVIESRFPTPLAASPPSLLGRPVDSLKILIDANA